MLVNKHYLFVNYVGFNLVKLCQERALSEIIGAGESHRVLGVLELGLLFALIPFC
jgi:hypothetical protein